ncbi:MAG: prenyltransferase, partial [Actinobacteria bacterium]|nr:prenyltransferase [Actinomycetota bacterium]
MSNDFSARNISAKTADPLTLDELSLTADSIAKLQLPNGMIPWFENGHCDPWNHVETAMALDVMGRHDNAQLAYEWLRTTQRTDGSWYNYFHSDGKVEETKLDSNVCAYIGTGLWHHWLCTQDRETVKHFWPMLESAMTWVLKMRRNDGTILWAREENEKPWDYALLTGCSSIRHALISASKIAAVLNTARPEWIEAAAQIDQVIQNDRDAFEPKDRWAMDWYYPVLTGALIGDAAKSRLAEQWNTFVMPELGVRCVSDEPWV